MPEHAKGIIITIVVTLVLIVGGALLYGGGGRSEAAASEAKDALAQCIAESGAKFYGAFWCPHCQDQKILFGNSKNLPYIECSTPDGQGQMEECSAAGIQNYPTWEFASGQRMTGTISLKSLAEVTGCEYAAETDPRQ